MSTIFDQEAPLTRRDFFKATKSSVRAYHRRIISRILFKWAKAAKFWSLLAVMTLPLSITRLHT